MIFGLLSSLSLAQMIVSSSMHFHATITYSFFFIAELYTIVYIYIYTIYIYLSIHYVYTYIYIYYVVFFFCFTDSLVVTCTAPVSLLFIDLQSFGYMPNGDISRVIR
jgi:hypothetical protein